MRIRPTGGSGDESHSVVECRSEQSSEARGHVIHTHHQALQSERTLRVRKLQRCTTGMHRGVLRLCSSKCNRAFTRSSKVPANVQQTSSWPDGTPPPISCGLSIGGPRLSPQLINLRVIGFPICLSPISLIFKFLVKQLARPPNCHRTSS